MRRIGFLTSLVLGLSLLSSCSAGGPYCDAVDAARDELTTFGTRTNAAFAAYADAVESIAESASAPIDEQWTQIAEATREVIAAHRDAGLRLQDMDDEVKVNALSREGIDRIDAAHEAFNDTRTQRAEVVRDVHDQCGIDLSEK